MWHDEVVLYDGKSKCVHSSFDFYLFGAFLAFLMVVIVRTVHVTVTTQLNLRLLNSCLNHRHDEVPLSLDDRCEFKFRVGELYNELFWL